MTETSNQESLHSSGSDNLFDLIEEEDLVEFRLKKDVINWSLKFNIPHNAINNLLTIMRSVGRADLPKDVRTLLYTPTKNHTKEMT